MKNETLVPRSALNVSDEDSKFEIFQSDSKDDTRQKFRIVANSGGIIENHPHWGNFAIDLEGLNIGRQRKPALYMHDSSKIVGSTHSIEITEEGLVAEGTFADTDHGREVMKLHESGFPWQASVYVPPKQIERLGEGETAEVNGHQISGPGHIFRKSSLREVTFTSLGADENTGTAEFSESIVINAVFTANTEEVAMSEPEKPEEVEETTSSKLSHLEDSSSTSESQLSYDEGVTDGRAAERSRVTSLLSASLTDQQDLVFELINRGEEESQGLRELLSDNKAKAEDRLSHQLNSTPEPVGPMTDEATDPKSAFLANPELVAEFGEYEIFQAFTKAQEGGSVRGRIE